MTALWRLRWGDRTWLARGNPDEGPAELLETASLAELLAEAGGFVVLFTGTGIVPPSTFSLAAGDEVSISISGLGELRKVVEVVGRTQSASA